MILQELEEYLEEVRCLYGIPFVLLPLGNVSKFLLTVFCIYEEYISDRAIFELPGTHSHCQIALPGVLCSSLSISLT